MIIQILFIHMYESVYFPMVAKTFKRYGSALQLLILMVVIIKMVYHIWKIQIVEMVLKVEVSEWMDFDFEIEEWIPIYEDLIF